MINQNSSVTISPRIFSPQLILSFAIIFLIVGALAGQLRVWSDDGFVVAAAFRYVALLALPLLFYAFYRFRAEDRPISLDTGGFALGLFLIFFSNWLENRFSLLGGAAIRGEVLVLTIAATLLVPRARITLIYCAAVLAPILMIWSFSHVAAGRVIFSDDHSVMIYRLNLLKQNFPNIPHYNPLWNAGLDARDFFATGILNVYFFFYPLIQFFPVDHVYNIIVGLCAFALLPLSIYGATRLIGHGSLAAAIASLVAVCSNLLWYRWVLKYGALGFVFSACVLPLVVALFYRFAFRSEPARRSETFLLVISSCLMLFWSPTALFLAPLAIVLALQARRVFARKDAWITAILVAALTLPWVAVFVSVSGVSSFVTAPAVTSQVELKDQREASIARALKGGKALLDPSSVVSSIREFGSEASPLLIVFGLPGLILLASRSARIVFCVLMLWLLLLGTIGNAIKPQLELDRALIVLGLLLSIPTAVAIESLIKKPIDRCYQSVLPSIACGFLLSSVFATCNVISNRSVENYSFAEEIVSLLPDAITRFGGDGRTVFPGFILHEFNNAHIAPIALMTGHPIVASSPFHNLWWYTELVPKEFLARGEEGIEQYFELMNTSSIVTHEPRWRSYFIARPDVYTLKWRHQSFSLFSRNRSQASYILDGNAEIKSQNSHSLSLLVESPRVVIKFNYFQFLRASSCSIHPHSIEGTKISLIELRDCTPGTTVTIEAVPAWKRVLS